MTDTTHTLESLSAMPDAELDALAAVAMEPMPEPITARELRDRARSPFVVATYSTHYAYSPKGWWRAEIGTDHNRDASGTYRAERDDALVTWMPACSPTADRNQSGALLAKCTEQDKAMFQVFHFSAQSFVGWRVEHGGLFNGDYDRVPGNSPRSEVIAALLAMQAIEEK